MKLWDVRFGNYEPAEVDSTHNSKEKARKRADELGGMWEVSGPYSVGPQPLSDIVAEQIVPKLREHGFTSNDTQALCLAEEAGEAVGAYRRWSGQARRSGTKEDFEAELADVVITTYVLANFTGVDLEKAIEAKLKKITTRGWRDNGQGT
jgi:NTP pyrophosphatase (non-canonical NTP hydrolase)